MDRGSTEVLLPITSELPFYRYDPLRIDKKLEKNAFGYYEIEFDKTKMFMKGSDQSYEPESAVFSTFTFGKS
jgi:hypothetical protein